MTFANQLTLSRILLTFLFMIFLFRGGFFYRALALFTFLTASATDLYDGMIARSRHQVSEFGKLMDPIADKILILAAFLAFVKLQLVPAWMVVFILMRELLITGVRLLALSKGKVLVAEKGGKHKTVTQVFAVVWVLLVLLVKEKGVSLFFLEVSVFFVMFVAVFVTVSSGVLYLFRNRVLFYAR
ncbi:MAG: CDP-diacylglycerol--glycerol-3-phosphate 3-phosphatidyltransferase [Candidatus Omnitrophota bacterium]